MLTYFPPFLEARKVSEKAPVAVKEARIAGVSTRRVGELVQAMGLASASRRSPSCARTPTNGSRIPGEK
jgi:hypothetical protein